MTPDRKGLWARAKAAFGRLFGTRPPAKNVQCSWEWDGLNWQPTGSGCPPEQTCPKPVMAGTFIGQTSIGTCV